MALAKPVVVTDSSGNRELVVDGETGFLTPPNDPEGLAKRIIYLIDHPDKRERLGIKGRQRIKNKFNMARLVNDHTKLYKKINRHK